MAQDSKVKFGVENYGGNDGVYTNKALKHGLRSHIKRMHKSGIKL